MDLALVTCRQLPEPDLDEEPLLQALRAAGVDARMLAWDDPQADFGAARLVLMRSPWNYYHQLESFVAWLTRLEGISGRVLNPLPVLRWNADKRYLHDLAAAGVPVIPTQWFERGDAIPLPQLLAAPGWSDVVLKPQVSASSFQTYRLTRERLTAGQQAAVRALAAERALMVQPYVRSVEGYGERALVYLDGAVTHSVHKSPTFADSSGKPSRECVAIADDERDFALRAIAAVATPSPLLYARVDVVRDDAGALQLMELELLEPSLYLVKHPPALTRLAQALRRELQTPIS